MCNYHLALYYFIETRSKPTKAYRNEEDDGKNDDEFHFFSLLFCAFDVAVASLQID